MLKFILWLWNKNWSKKYKACWYFKFCTKTNLAGLKTEVDKLDIDKLLPVPVDLSKLSDVVKNNVKKAVYDKLIAKVSNIDTRGFVLKIKYHTDQAELEKKIPDVTDLVKNQISLN